MRNWCYGRSVFQRWLKNWNATCNFIVRQIIFNIPLTLMVTTASDCQCVINASDKWVCNNFIKKKKRKNEKKNKQYNDDITKWRYAVYYSFLSGTFFLLTFYCNYWVRNYFSLQLVLTVLQYITTIAFGSITLKREYLWQHYKRERFFVKDWWIKGR